MSHINVEETLPHSGASRRAVLKGAVVGVGVLWATPTIATFTAGPAAASPAGCLDCGQLVLPTADGDGTSLASWTAVSGIAATGGVFAASSTARGTATFTRDFSDACTARFGTAPAVDSTFSVGSLTAGHGGTSTVTLRFWSGLGGTGSVLLTVTRATAGSSSALIPAGTRSFTVQMSLGGRNNGGQQPGTADNIAVTIGSC